MLNLKNVTKKYGKNVACSDISMDVAPGELAVLLGPNGAGKSTLIKSICGLLRFTGEIQIGGYSNFSPQAKRLLGYVPEMPALYPMLTVWEHLEFIVRAYRLGEWEPYAARLLDEFDLDDKKKKLGRELSKGMQQKVSICCALLPRPSFVIMDEPLVGLDPHAIRALKTKIMQLKSDGCALIISTHMIESVADNWDATYIMKGGTVASVCRRETAGPSLEDLYFSIVGEHGSES